MRKGGVNYVSESRTSPAPGFCCPRRRDMRVPGRQMPEIVSRSRGLHGMCADPGQTAAAILLSGKSLIQFIGHLVDVLLFDHQRRHQAKHVAPRREHDQSLVQGAFHNLAYGKILYH